MANSSIAPPNALPGMKKAALLVGCNYQGTANVPPLSGCVNDVVLAKTTLVQSYGFDTSNIKTLVDDPQSTLYSKDTLPTKTNILKALKDWSPGQRPGTCSCFITVAMGLSDKTAILVPSDIEIDSKTGVFNNCLLDTEFKGAFDSLSKGVSVYLILDCCHSGAKATRDLPSTQVSAPVIRYLPNPNPFIEHGAMKAHSAARDLAPTAAPTISNLFTVTSSNQDSPTVLSACRFEEPAQEFNAYGAFSYFLYGEAPKARTLGIAGLKKLILADLQANGRPQIPNVNCMSDRVKSAVSALASSVGNLHSAQKAAEYQALNTLAGPTVTALTALAAGDCALFDDALTLLPEHTQLRSAAVWVADPLVPSGLAADVQSGLADVINDALGALTRMPADERGFFDDLWSTVKPMAAGALQGALGGVGSGAAGMAAGALQGAIGIRSVVGGGGRPRGLFDGLLGTAIQILDAATRDMAGPKTGVKEQALAIVQNFVADPEVISAAQQLANPAGGTLSYDAKRRGYKLVYNRAGPKAAALVALAAGDRGLFDSLKNIGLAALSGAVNGAFGGRDLSTDDPYNRDLFGDIVGAGLSLFASRDLSAHTGNGLYDGLLTNAISTFGARDLGDPAVRAQALRVVQKVAGDTPGASDTVQQLVDNSLLMGAPRRTQLYHTIVDTAGPKVAALTALAAGDRGFFDSVLSILVPVANIALTAAIGGPARALVVDGMDRSLFGDVFDFLKPIAIGAVNGAVNSALSRDLPVAGSRRQEEPVLNTALALLSSKRSQLSSDDLKMHALDVIRKTVTDSQAVKAATDLISTGANDTAAYCALYARAGPSVTALTALAANNRGLFDSLLSVGKGALLGAMNGALSGMSRDLEPAARDQLTAVLGGPGAAALENILNGVTLGTSHVSDYVKALGERSLGDEATQGARQVALSMVKDEQTKSKVSDLFSGATAVDKVSLYKSVLASNGQNGLDAAAVVALGAGDIGLFDALVNVAKPTSPSVALSAGKVPVGDKRGFFSDMLKTVTPLAIGAAQGAFQAAAQSVLNSTRDLDGKATTDLVQQAKTEAVAAAADSQAADVIQKMVDKKSAITRGQRVAGYQLVYRAAGCRATALTALAMGDRVLFSDIFGASTSKVQKTIIAPPLFRDMTFGDNNQTVNV
ncbi:hypothetical protein KFL_007100040 [Klebsormidium nitens]|uniref:Peptidase C14 caspase domain-containing protein n=1 Tax=Klebsormidium nitens TaxID=105231 RepID=A0A1Y1IQT5_KLENI|nr:hypothetical protein KFL_007100040 [Klebsormidium nitens]|eukprot:GAQ90987.1 hypothetical protein KFL_007100040 [Klebsormidium nitens]